MSKRSKIIPPLSNMAAILVSPFFPEKTKPRSRNYTAI